MDFSYTNLPNEFIGLPQERKDDYLLFFSGRADGIEQIIALIQVDANVDRITSFGHTPLMCAIFHGCQANVCLLIQAGANIDIANENCETAFSIAMHEQYLELAFLLFSMMSLEQIKKEIEYDALRASKLPDFSSSIMPYIKQFMIENNKKSFETLGILFNRKNKKNPLAFFPTELKRLIYFKFLVVSTKMAWQQYCSKTINAHIVLDHDICWKKTLIFSSHKKQSVEQRLSSLSLEDQTDATAVQKKSTTKKRGCVIC